MSTIHEALKRVQKQRDNLSPKYGGIVASRSKERRAFGRGALVGGIGLLILLAFVSYLWFNFKPIERQATAESRAQDPAPSPRPASFPIERQATAESGEQDRAPSPRPASFRQAEASYKKAHTDHKKGSLEEARRHYQETLKIDPGHVDALNNLGVIQLYFGDYPAAQASFEKAIHLRPESADPFYNLACLHALRGQTEQGLAHLKKAVSLNPQVRGWAQKDRDLERLRRLPEFEEIISQSAPLRKGAGTGLERANQAH